jgi:signal transduction histidine kinase
VAALAAIAGAYPTADAAARDRLVVLAGQAVASLERLLMDAATESLRREPVEAGGLARAAAETAALGGTPVQADVEDGLVVSGDRDRLRQALDNLIGNAVGHSPSAATVTVSARREGGMVVIAVTDQGEGIDPADVAGIFEPGVRLTTARPGSGLGLAVVRAVAHEHGGEVEVESSPGAGSTFRLVLPGASAAG